MVSTQQSPNACGSVHEQEIRRQVKIHVLLLQSQLVLRTSTNVLLCVYYRTPLIEAWLSLHVEQTVFTFAFALGRIDPPRASYEKTNAAEGILRTTLKKFRIPVIPPRLQPCLVSTD